MSRQKVYLIGTMKQQILGSKLPSIGDCLSVLFYNMRIVKFNLSDAANLVIDEFLIFWKKARIPTKDKSDCVKKLKELYEMWRKLEKSSKKTSVKKKENEDTIKENINNLFVIAHTNALNMINIEEDKNFLVAQRKSQREGYMIGIDVKLSEAEKRKAERNEKEEVEKKKAQAETFKYQAVPIPTTSNTESELTDIEGNADIRESETSAIETPISCTPTLANEYLWEEPSISGVRRGRKLIINNRLAAAMDKCKVSDRDAVHILTACIESLSLNPLDYVINRTSLKRARQNHREDMAKKIQNKFSQRNVEFAVVHWDSKLLPDITGMKKVDRLPVIEKTPSTEQLLGVPHIPSGSGREIASAVFDTLDKWSLQEKIEAFVFDTTSANTGRLNGACSLLEMSLGRNILLLACRHHIFVLVLQAAISEAKLYSSTGPEILLFKKFKAAFPKINCSNILNCNTNKELLQLICESREETLLFCMNQLQANQQQRDDYRELLEVVIILLGGTLSNGNKIRQPGAYHQARWMSKAIYAIKIFLLRGEFAVSKFEEKALYRICGFIVTNYITPWFTANRVTEAPWRDICLLRSLKKYKKKTL